MPDLSRRQFLTSCAAAGMAAAGPSVLFPTRHASAAPATLIRAATRTIEVNGRAATVYGLMQADGTLTTGRGAVEPIAEAVVEPLDALFERL